MNKLQALPPSILERTLRAVLEGGPRAQSMELANDEAGEGVLEWAGHPCSHIGSRAGVGREHAIDQRRLANDKEGPRGSEDEETSARQSTMAANKDKLCCSAESRRLA